MVIPHVFHRLLNTPIGVKPWSRKFNAFLENVTWELVPHTPMNVVGCKWIFKTKLFKSDGSIKRYKAHLVAFGNHRQAGIGYQETFILVVKSSTIRLLLSIVVSYQWTICQ